MSDKVGIFIDGAYLDKILQDEFGSPRIDYEKLANWLSQEQPYSELTTTIACPIKEIHLPRMKVREYHELKVFITGYHNYLVMRSN